jgi:hypothetical protein
MTDEGSDVMTFMPRHKGRSVEPSAVQGTKTVIHERKHCYLSPPSSTPKFSSWLVTYLPVQGACLSAFIHDSLVLLPFKALW